MQIFREAVQLHGRPLEVRTDKGMESILVVYDQHLVGLGAITGRSVHNVRIERHWRDVNEKVLNFFKRYLILIFLFNNTVYFYI